jgi:hypothetical protein
MRLQLLFVILACCTLAGCHATQPSVTQDIFVGNYVYISHDPDGKATDHNLDRLVLQSDGRYDLVEGGSTKPKAEKTGFWHFSGGDAPVVDLDHAGYPVRIKGADIRLLIDDDTGIWYEKVR